MKNSLRQKALQLTDELVKIRRDLHMHPELSFEEYRTGKIVAEKLREMGIDVIENVGKTGVLGVLKGGKDGRVVALRADMDALPIEEKNEVEYKSKVKGIMHACGHDVHTTCLLGAAKLLSSIREQLQGTVKFIFQPSEEVNHGAKAMIQDKVMVNPHVEAIYGLHNSPNIPVGSVGVKSGPLMAAVDTIKIKIKGESGHGAVPDKARDALVAAASAVLNLQTIVSRKIPPIESAVVSIGTIKGGRANNIICEEVEMTGTVRTFNPEIRKKIPEIMKNIIKQTCGALDTQGELEYIFDLPAVINDKTITDIGRKAVVKIVGEENVIVPSLTGGGEDFAVYQQEVPGCFYFLGVRNEQKGIIHQWHHPCFDVDERAIPIGAGILAQSAYEFLMNS